MPGKPRHKRGEVETPSEAKRRTAKLLKGAYDDAQPPPPKREKKPSTHIDPPVTSEAAAHRQAQANIRRGLTDDDAA